MLQLQVKVDGIDGVVTPTDGGRKWDVVLAGIKPGTYSPHILGNNSIVLAEDITVNSALGGDGDLP